MTEIDEDYAEYLRLKAEKAEQEAARSRQKYEGYVSGQERSPYAGLHPPGENPQPRDVWLIALDNGQRLNRDQLLEALRAAGWKAKYEGRACSLAIRMNMEAGNIAMGRDRRYFIPSDAERREIMDLPVKLRAERISNN